MVTLDYVRQHCLMWSKLGIVFLFSCILLFFMNSCSSNGMNERIRGQLEVFQGQKISFMLDSMSCFYGLEEMSKTLETSDSYKFVLFTDSDECSSCALTSFYDWEPLIERESKIHKSKIDFIFIFSPKASDLSKLKKKILHANIHHPIYIDSNGVFVKSNDIPHNHLFHTFLVDPNNQVVVVGNPLISDKIRDLMDKVIDGEIEDNHSTNSTMNNN